MKLSHKTVLNENGYTGKKQIKAWLSKKDYETKIKVCEMYF